MSEPRKSPEGADEELLSRTRDAEERSGFPLGGVLAALACLIGLVRFVRLGEWSLWIDEVLTVADFQNRLGEGNVVNQGGYALIAWVSAFFEPTPDTFALRFLPALVGWLHLPVLWLLWRKPVGSLQAGAAALLLAVSPWHLYWSQNVRFYTFASFCALVGVSLAFRVLYEGSRPELHRRRLLFGLFGFGGAVVAILFHPSTALAVFALGLSPWIVWALEGRPEAGPDQRRTGRLFAQAILVLCFLGALVAFPRLRAAFEEYRYHKSTPSPAAFLLTTGYYFHPAVCAAAVVGAVVAWRRKSRYGLALLVFVALCGAVALAASFQARVVAQYVFFTLPFVLLLACSAIERPLRSVHVALFGALFASGLAGSALYLTRYEGERPRWKEAYEWVYGQAGDEDKIVGMAAPVGEYYIAPSTPDYRRPERVAWIDSYRPRRMQESARNPQRMWIVIHPDWFGDWDAEEAESAKNFLRDQCRMVQEFPLPVGTRNLGIQVYLRE